MPDLLPGPYRLELRQYATPGDPASGEIAFPVITAITISRATPSTPPGGPSTATVTTVRAPLPPLQPTVTGLILGRNSDNRAVRLPSSAGTYAITGTFTEPSIEINGSTTVPNPSQGNSVAVIDPAAVAAAGTTGMVPYTFSNVPAGAHELTIATTPAAAMTGYTLDGSPTRSFAADIGVVAGPNFTYTVSDVQLRIQFPTGTYPDITTMRLTSPTGQAVYGTGAPTTVATFDDETDELIFEGVAPELGDFKLDFDDALHAPVSQANVSVAPDLDGNATFVSTFDLRPTPAGDMGRLRGSVAQRNTATDSTGLQAGGSITVTRTSGLGACAAPTPCNVTVVPGMTEYQIDLAPGSYSVVTAQTDFQSQTVNVTVNAGQIRPQDLSISRYATFTFTITNDPLPTNTTMVLSDGTPAVYTGTTAPAAGGGTAYTFKVPAQTPGGVQKYYTGAAAAPGFQTRNLPNDLDSYAPEIGSTTTVTPFGLTARSFTVTVNTAPSGPAPAGTEVVARFGGLAFPDVVAPFTFSSAAIPTLPLAGIGTAVADAPGHRANSATIPESGSPSPIAIAPVVTVSGTITKPAGTATLPLGTKVTATAPGMAPIEANVTVDPLPGGTGNGSYTLTGLDVGLDLAGVPESKAWTIVYDVVGVGRFTDTVNVTPTSASSVPLSFTPELQSVNVVFTVTGTANGSVDVTFSGETKPVTPSPAGTPVSFTALENETALGYTVDGPGYLTVAPGTVVFAANRANTPVAVPITVRPSITGTVSSGPPSNSNVNNATVRVCPVSAPAMCAAGPTAPADTTNNSGVFVIPELVPEGTYRLWAVGPGGGTPPDGFATLTVAANRSYTLSPSTIVLD